MPFHMTLFEAIGDVQIPCAEHGILRGGTPGCLTVASFKFPWTAQWFLYSSEMRRNDDLPFVLEILWYQMWKENFAIEEPLWFCFCFQWVNGERTILALPISLFMAIPRSSLENLTREVTSWDVF